MNKTHKWLTAAVAGIALLLGGIVMNSAQTATTEPLAAREFDQKLWIAARGVQTTTNPRRGLMEAALGTISPGFTMNQVVASLGEPDYRSPAKWKYVAGARKGFSSDDLVLMIEFENGLVTKAFPTYTASAR